MRKKLEDMSFDDLVDECAAMEINSLISGEGSPRKRIYSIVELAVRWRHQMTLKESESQADPDTSQVGPATDDQIEMMKEFWSSYGGAPHIRTMNATLLKRDFLSLIARIEEKERDS